jgi:hypothetical protein
MHYIIEPMEGLAILVLLFSFIFWYTSRQKSCWYRRYLLPLMVASFALVLPTFMGKLIVLVAAILVYYGYRGYGKEVKKEKK